MLSTLRQHRPEGPAVDWITGYRLDVACAARCAPRYSKVCPATVFTGCDKMVASQAVLPVTFSL